MKSRNHLANKRSARFSAGFTLIELMITIALIAIFGGLGLFVSMDFYRRYSFYADQGALVSILRRAREYSLANIGSVPHGIRITDDQYILFQGTSYANRDSQYDEPIQKSPSILTQGISEIVFTPLSATSSTSGIITISNSIQSRDIEINSEGRINW